MDTNYQIKSENNLNLPVGIIKWNPKNPLQQLESFLWEVVDILRGNIFDGDNLMTDSMSAIQIKINASHTRLNRIRNTQIFARSFVAVNSWMLRKYFDNFGLIITRIMEHDADADGSYSMAYDSVDDLINFLDS